MSADPWAFQRWAFAQTAGSPTRKALLSALAAMADASTGRCEAKQGTLAAWVEVSERSIREHLRGLVEAGLIAQRHQYRIDGTRRGSEFLLLGPGVTEWPDGQSITGEIASSQEELPATERRHNRRATAGQEQPPRNDHPKRNTPISPTDGIQEVWEHYDVTVAKPNRLRRQLGDTEKRIIRTALSVRPKAEVLRAIDGLARSPHHNGKNDRSKKYLELRYALRGNGQRGETPEQRIDMMCEIAAAPNEQAALEPLVKRSDAWKDTL
jgi:hypothetical protein